MRAKFKKLMKKAGGDGWTEIPNCLLMGDDWPSVTMPLQARHRCMLIALLARDYHGGFFKVGLRTLGEATGLGNDSIIQTTSDLEQLGLITVNRHKRCTNEYSLEGFYTRFVELALPKAPPAPTPEVKPYMRPADATW
jgi:hypothetical protein